MKVRPPAFRFNPSTLALNLLIVVSMLLALAGPGLAAPSPAPGAQSGITLALDKTATPTTANPGQAITFALTATNTGSQAAHDLVLQDTLPRQLWYVHGSAPETEYHWQDRTLTWHLDSLAPGQQAEFSFQARVVALPGREVENEASLEADGVPAVHASASVEVERRFDVGQSTISPRQGGELALCDGQVTLTYKPGTVERRTVVLCLPLEPVDLPTGQTIFARYALLAFQRFWPHDRVDAFDRPVTLTTAYDAGQIEGLLEETIQFRHWDEDQVLWATMPAQLDEGANTVTAQVSQLGVYGLQAGKAPTFHRVSKPGRSASSPATRPLPTNWRRRLGPAASTCR